ncbi:hypothetical protein RAS1_10580 [Phycisphaerae bacterium RAS1]|nr:hypothetical protein RAS1_10580 [Phycisphaerae bacterium RAS1]
MPVIRTKAIEQSTVLEDALRRELAAELTAAEDDGKPLQQPIVLQNEVEDPGQSIHVTVVWERWRPVSAGTRTKIIEEAYRSELPGYADRIATAFGMTTLEAVDAGLLPWEVVTRDGAILWFGGVETERGPLLRLPTRKYAERAAEAINLKYPQSEAQVVDRSTGTA